jgi:hypothetical protein
LAGKSGPPVENRFGDALRLSKLSSVRPAKAGAIANEETP